MKNYFRTAAIALTGLLLIGCTTVPSKEEQGVIIGAIAGGILGNQVGGGSGRTVMTVVGAGAGAYAGHEIEKNVKRSTQYQIRVRMHDGSYRTFFQRSQPALSLGQKVRVTERGLVAAG